jgi:hypothetical protein
MSRLHDLLASLEVLTSTLHEALAKGDDELLLNLLSQRQEVVSELSVIQEQAGPEEAARLTAVQALDDSLTEKMCAEKLILEQGLIDIFASRQGRRAYRRAA